MLSKIKKIFIITTSLTSLMALIAMPTLVNAGVVAAPGAGPGTGTGTGTGTSSVNNSITGGICTGITSGTNTGGGLTLNPTDNAANASNCTNDKSAGNTLGNIITEVINIMSILVGAICVIMIIVGGFRYVTSGGESNSVSGAKNTIIYAIVGLVIVALAQVIVHFVLSRLVSPTS
jgi:hypothetical protein